MTFNGSPRTVTTPHDAGLLTIPLYASDVANIGPVPVTVTNPGSSNLSSSFNFTVLDPHASQPVVTSISTNERVYVAGDYFTMTYSVLAGSATGSFDLMVAIKSLARSSTA